MFFKHIFDSSIIYLIKFSKQNLFDFVDKQNKNDFIFNFLIQTTKIKNIINHKFGYKQKNRDLKNLCFPYYVLFIHFLLCLDCRFGFRLFAEFFLYFRFVVYLFLFCLL